MAEHGSQNNTLPQNILHSGMFISTLREWQTTECTISPGNLMYPLFIV